MLLPYYGEEANQAVKRINHGVFQVVMFSSLQVCIGVALRAQAVGPTLRGTDLAW